MFKEAFDRSTCSEPAGADRFRFVSLRWFVVIAVVLVCWGEAAGKAVLLRSAIYHCAGFSGEPIATAPKVGRVATFGDSPRRHDDGGIACLWDVETGRLVFSAECPFHPNAHALSPDGKQWFFARNSKKNGTRIHGWDVASGKELAELQAPPGFDTKCMAVSPSKKYLAAGGGEGLVIWRLGDGKILFRKKLDGPCEQIVYAPDGVSVFGGTRSGLVQWKLPSGKVLCSYQAGKRGGGAVPIDRVDNLAVSPDGRRIAAIHAVGMGRRLGVWNVGSPEPIAETAVVNGKPVGRTYSYVAFSVDGQRLLVSGSKSGILSASDLSVQSESSGWVGSFGMFGRDGKEVFVFGAKRVNRWNPATNSVKIGFPVEGHAPRHSKRSGLPFLCVVPGGNVVSVGSCKVMEWDLSTASARRTFDCRTDRELGEAIEGSVTASHDGKRILFKAGFKWFVLWDNVAWREVRRIPCPFPGARIWMCGDGSRAIHTTNEKKLRIVDLANGETSDVPFPGDRKHYLLSMAPDLRTALFTNDPASVSALWDVTTGKKVKELPPFNVKELFGPEVGAFSSDGALAFQWAGDFIFGCLKVWDTKTGKLRGVLRRNLDEITKGKRKSIPTEIVNCAARSDGTVFTCDSQCLFALRPGDKKWERLGEESRFLDNAALVCLPDGNIAAVNEFGFLSVWDPGL